MCHAFLFGRHGQCTRIQEPVQIGARRAWCDSLLGCRLCSIRILPRLRDGRRGNGPQQVDAARRIFGEIRGGCKWKEIE